MDAPGKSHSSPGLTSPEHEPLSFARLGAHSWAGSYPPLGPQPWSRVGAQRCLETYVSIAPRAWSSTSQLSSVSPGQTPLQVLRREYRHHQDCVCVGGGVQRAGSTGPWRAPPEPEGHISNQKPTGICKQYGEGLAPESSRELVGCHKLLTEADVCKQQSGLLVMESMGSRSLPKVIIDPESLPRSGLCWGKRSSWCHCCKSYPAPLLGTRQEPETGTLCQLFSMLSTGGMIFG